MTKTMRKSVSLTEDELKVLEELRAPDSEAATALREFVHLPAGGASEAAVLHALVALGLERIRESIDVRGYQELAESYGHDPDDQADREAAREHRDRSATRWALDD